MNSPPESQCSEHIVFPNAMIHFISRTYLQLVLLGVCLLFLFNHTIVELGKELLNNPDSSHGFFVPLISILMVWRKRPVLIQTSICPCTWGLMALGLGLVMHLIGNIAAELFTMRFAIIVTLLGLTLYLCGWLMVREVFVPIGYLIFMIPLPAIIWNQLAFPLQLLASKTSAYIITFLGIPILREGNVLNLANTTLEVVEACSGLRSLSALLALSGLLAYLYQLRVSSKWILFLSAIPVALVANICRLSATAALAYYFGVGVAEGFMHSVSGLLVFVAALLMLLGVHKLLVQFEPTTLSHTMTH